MAQKSILSFFKSSDGVATKENEKPSLKKPEKEDIKESLKRPSLKKPEKEDIKESLKSKPLNEDSPVKKRKRKIKCIESDDEAPDTAKTINGDPSKDVDENKKDEQTSEKIVKSEKISKKVNGVSSSKKPSKLKKLENSVEEKSPEPVVEMDTKEDNQKSQINGKNSTDSVDMPSSSTQNDSVELTPKRKTARKQMKSARKTEKNSSAHKVEEDSKSKNGEEEEIKSASKNTSDSTSKDLSSEINGSKNKDASNYNSKVDSQKDTEMEVSCDTSGSKSIPVVEESKNNSASEIKKIVSSEKSNDNETVSVSKNSSHDDSVSESKSQDSEAMETDVILKIENEQDSRKSQNNKTVKIKIGLDKSSKGKGKKTPSKKAERKIFVQNGDKNAELLEAEDALLKSDDEIDSGSDHKNENSGSDHENKDSESDHENKNSGSDDENKSLKSRNTACKTKNISKKEVKLKKSIKKVSIQDENPNVEIKKIEDSVSKSDELNSENDQEKETPGDSVKLTKAKPKAKNTPKKQTSSKKPAKKESSIQNFFAPIKKQDEETKKKKSNAEEDGKEDAVNRKSENEDICKDKDKRKNDESKIISKDINVKKGEESKLTEADDSPVKRVSKSRKKARLLDSDEEDEQQDSSAEPTKMEIEEPQKSHKSPEKPKNSPVTLKENGTHKTPQKSETASKTSQESGNVCQISEKSEAKSNTPEKNGTELKDIEKAETSAVKTPSKNSPSSKNEGEKQKFGFKSTSSGTVYDPSKNHYHPIEDACWKQNEKVPYLALAKTLELIENTSGRLKIIEILSNFFRSVIVLSPNDLLQSVYLCLNRLAPEYEGIELGVGETLLMKAVAQATGRTLQQIKAEVAVKGDLGLVSESSRGNQRVMFAPPKLTVSSVFSKFLEIAKMSGNSSMAKKTDKIQSLFVACRDCEAKYIIRSLSGKLRIGLAEQSVLTAIARAAVLTPPGQSYPPEVIDASKGISEKSFKEVIDSQTLILKTAYCECPNYDLIIPVLLKDGISALPKCCQLSPGRPLKPMLAHPTAGIDIILERFDKHAFTCEYKYDGERAQIHRTEEGEVKIFSRNQEDNTSKYPDVISRICNALKDTTKSFILDSEAVAWDKETKQILPFQVLSTRKKKDAVESEIKVQVCIMAFDLLYLNGESLVKKPLKERRSLLHSSFNEVENEFMFAQYKDGNSAETMQEFLDESVKGNCEGLMVKALETDASYEIAKRSHNWLKLKKDYLQGVGDTLDLVVIGGYFGKGKRTGNYGGFLLACYDEENEEFQSICKLGTGFKDDILEAHTTFLKQHIIEGPKSYYRYDHSHEPDVWFEAVQVWEIKCADISISPVHKAAVGIVDPEKGISLRFPRFIRIRDDKTPENATNSVQIADMYRNQEQIQNTANKAGKVEEDYY